MTLLIFERELNVRGELLKEFDGHTRNGSSNEVTVHER